MDHWLPRTSAHPGRPHTAAPAAARARIRASALACALLLACALICAGMLGGRAAWADMPQTGSDPITDAVPDELQQRVEETAAAYNEAVAQREALEAQAADLEAQIAETEAKLPAAQDAAADALYMLYRFQQSSNGLVELLLSAEDFNSFISTVQYLNSVNNHTVGQLEELGALVDQLEQQQADLQAALDAARVQEEAAQTALAEAQAAREEAQRRAEEAARQRAAEEAARAAAAAAAAESAGAGSSESGAAADGSAGETAPAPDAGGNDAGTDAGGGAAVEEPSGDVVWSERDAFVAEWGARIDAYLAGSPLSGYGSTFAAAAWDYGVDPRWSPAIAYAESSLGAYCFLPHNAWGWGSVSWGSWDEAIYGHVAGLARGYGYTITYEAAQRYCPPNADYWYAVVSEQMSYI